MRVSRERRPKGSRRKLPLLLAVFMGLLALMVLGLAPARGAGLRFLVAALLLAVISVPLGWIYWHRTPFDISARVPWRLSMWPKRGWYQRPFLGWSEGFLGEPRWAMGTEEDSVGVVGPPRVNKTLGSGIPQVLLWGGPLVSIAPKPQVFRATAAHRRPLAEKYVGGRVMIYAPTEDGRIEGLKPIHFSPSGSRDPNVVKLRVASWIEAAKTGKDVENADHWRTGAARILRGLFLASAHHRVRPGDFTLVREWLGRRRLEEPIQILRDLRTFAGDQWANELEGVLKTPERERGSFFSSAETTIEATSNPNVLRSTTATDFDPEEFLETRSSLYVVSPTEHQKAIAPLLSMLVETIVHTAYRMHREGRLEARLLLSLDDLANCCPLPQLESICSQGGGQGVNVAWSLQSLAQLRDHFGVEAAEAIWSATRCKVVFGGLIDEQSLDRLSGVIREERVRTRGETETDKGRRRSVHESWRRRLSPGQLREIPDGWALLIYLNQEPRMLRQPLAFKRRHFRAAMLPWSVAERQLEEAAELAPAEPEPPAEAA